MGIFSKETFLFQNTFFKKIVDKLDRVKRIWYLSPMRAAKVQASLRIHAVKQITLLHGDLCGRIRDTRQNGLFYRQQIAYIWTNYSWIRHI